MKAVEQPTDRFSLWNWMARQSGPVQPLAKSILFDVSTAMKVIYILAHSDLNIQSTPMIRQ
jgi:hypothetical protein